MGVYEYFCMNVCEYICMNVYACMGESLHACMCVCEAMGGESQCDHTPAGIEVLSPALKVEHQTWFLLGQLCLSEEIY